MNLARSTIVLLITGMLFVLPKPAISMIFSSNFRSGALAPRSPNHTVRLDTMRVTFRLAKHSYAVDAIFQLFNEGETVTEWVGIPIFGYGPKGDSVARYDFISFDAWVDGRKAIFVEERDVLAAGIAFPRRLIFQSKVTYRWRVCKLRFRGNAKTVVRIRYVAPYSRYKPGMVVGPGATRALRSGMVYYIYGIASWWRGLIGKTTFIVDGTDLGGIKNVGLPLIQRKGNRVISDNLLFHEIRNYVTGAPTMLRLVHTAASDDKSQRPPTSNK